MTIYRVVVRVRPLSTHPMYFEIQFGHLFVWIAASDEHDASERALSVVSPLPYEVVGSKVLVQIPKPEALRANEKFVSEVKSVGLSLQLIACSTGVDEGDFATELGDDFDSL